MVQAISKAVTVASLADIPFNSVMVDKLCDVTKTDVNTFTLNKCGVYLVHVDAVVSATSAAGGVVSFNLIVDDVVQQQAYTAETTADNTGLHAISFDTLVQVDRCNNKCNCCNKPVRVSVRNTGVEALVTSANIILRKVC